MSSLTKP